jgi:Ser/Thr protein kinase RdoA (MazF antagonist)
MLQKRNADDEAARAALRHWPHVGPVRHIAPVTTAAFSGASIFRVTADCGSYALRRWPPGQMPEARLRELHRFLAFLQEEGIDEVPVPLAGESGTLLKSSIHRWQLEPWMPGNADFHSHPSQPRLENVMRLLARIHVVAERYIAADTGEEWFYQQRRGPSYAVQERLMILRRWESKRLEEQIRHDAPRRDAVMRCVEVLGPVVRAELESVESACFRQHPCLRDIWSEHVLFTNDEVTGIIDPSAARTENVASDLSRLLGSLLPDGGEPREKALDTYSAVRPLGLHERRLVRVLDRSGILLSALHWVEQFGARGSLAQNPHAASRYAAVLQRLERLAAQIGGA